MPTRIAVAVATYRRPHDLPRLLSALVPHISEAGVDSDVSVVVADNDPEHSARETLAAWRAAEPSDVADRVRLVHEPRPGIAAVRNRLLDETVGSDVVVFIDDDEIPTDGWLSSLVQLWRGGGVDLVAGPVRPVYGSGVPAWIEQGPFHDAPHLPTGAVMDHAAAGNLLVDRRAVLDLGARFPDLGTRGGEDSMFTRGLTAAGARLRWCAEAVVLEPVTPSRATPGWVTRRSMGNGLTWGSMLVNVDTGRHAPRSRMRRMQVSVQGTARVAGGIGTLALGAMTGSPARVGWGVHRLARGLGMVGGAWGLVHDEYARAGHPRWRRESGIATT